MELILTWVIKAEHTGALSGNPSFAWIKRKFYIFCTGSRLLLSWGGDFIPTLGTDWNRLAHLAPFGPVWPLL